MPTTNSWSSSSTSTCLPNLRHASPRRQSTQPAQPNRCSGDFGGGDVDSIQFFVRIGKVGLEGSDAIRDLWRINDSFRKLQCQDDATAAVPTTVVAVIVSLGACCLSCEAASESRSAKGSWAAVAVTFASRPVYPR